MYVAYVISPFTLITINEILCNRLSSYLVKINPAVCLGE